MTTPHLKLNSRSSFRLGSILITLALVCFALSQRAQGVVPPPPGGYSNFTTAAGDHALQALTLGLGNTAIGTFSLFSVTTGNFNTAVGAGSLDLNTADENTATGAAALLFNTTGTENTANGTAALELNDSGSFNTAVGAFALLNNVDGGQNTVVGTGAGPNLVAATDSSNTYLGQFVGSTIGGEINTIRIADISIDGFGSAACFIGGIFNNFQPVGGSVVEVTLDLNTDKLGWDVGPNQSAPSVPSRSAPVRRGAPQPAARPQRTALSQPVALQALQRQARLGDKVEKLQATVAQQQKQIETLTAKLREQADSFTAQLKEQATQIQKVSAQLEASKPAPQVVKNP
jgi:hypothetical protein